MHRLTHALDPAEKTCGGARSVGSEVVNAVADAEWLPGC